MQYQTQRERQYAEWISDDGVVEDYVVSLMDQDILETMDMEHGTLPCRSFLREYHRRHYRKFGSEFVVN